MKLSMPKLDFGKQARHLERAITDNSPMILTAIGVVGTVATAVLTWKATSDADLVLYDAAGQRNLNREATDPYYTASDFSRKEKFQLTWKLYIAPFVAGTLTCASIIGAQKINAKRAAALAGVLALTQDDLKEYKNKVQEKMTGPAKDRLETELAQDRANEMWESEDPILIADDGDTVCIETYTKRQFPSSMNAIQRAANEINALILKHDASTVSEFYDRLGIDHTDPSEEFGWNHSNKLEISFKSILLPSGRPALTFTYDNPPVYRPWEQPSFH